MSQRKTRKIDPDADLDEELSNYEPSDSDEDYDDNEKILLEKARKGKGKVYLDGDEDEDDEEEDSDNEEEVLGVYSSDEDKSEDDEKNADSDIENTEGDGLPDPKAWGKQKKRYYNTDYVDQDYGGFSRQEEEEVAMMEEKEAKTLQSRLAAQLDDVDLSLGIISKVADKVEDKVEATLESDDGDVVKTDLTKLSRREKLALFEKESPEFAGLINDFTERLAFAKDKLLPVVNLIESGRIAKFRGCSKFINLKTELTLNYCVNLAFYLLLKSRRTSVQDHPVTSRLLSYRNLLQQLDSYESPEFAEELNTIVQHIENKTVDDLLLVSNVSRKKKLKLLDEYKEETSTKELKSKSSEVDVSDLEIDQDGSDDNSDFEDEESEDESPQKKRAKFTDEPTDNNDRRRITYEMVKNKGLTPRRKKEERNPRVKNREKYRKALIRRKGQVSEPRKELQKYSGEIFGIKASVIRSRKLK